MQDKMPYLLETMELKLEQVKENTSDLYKKEKV